MDHVFVVVLTVCLISCNIHNHHNNELVDTKSPSGGATPKACWWNDVSMGDQDSECFGVDDRPLAWTGSMSVSHLRFRASKGTFARCLSRHMCTISISTLKSEPNKTKVVGYVSEDGSTRWTWKVASNTVVHMMWTLPFRYKTLLYPLQIIKMDQHKDSIRWTHTHYQLGLQEKKTRIHILLGLL
jgi:hypothetical protein